MDPRVVAKIESMDSLKPLDLNPPNKVSSREHGIKKVILNNCARMNLNCAVERTRRILAQSGHHETTTAV